MMVGTLENMRCVRKIPKSCGGDDKYNNLIIVHKEMERLIKSQDSKEIKTYIYIFFFFFLWGGGGVFAKQIQTGK